jgi:hypothetical protein
MSDEFGAMFEEVKGAQAAAAAKAAQAADQARSQAESGFRLKAKCLVEIVLPTLEEAKASFAEKGLVLNINSRAEVGSIALHSDPRINFNFSKSLGAPADLRVNAQIGYFYEVTHTQGGLRCGREKLGVTGSVNSEDLSSQFKIGNANNLTRDEVVKFIKFALKEVCS